MVPPNRLKPCFLGGSAFAFAPKSTVPNAGLAFTGVSFLPPNKAANGEAAALFGVLPGEMDLVPSLLCTSGFLPMGVTGLGESLGLGAALSAFLAANRPPRLKETVGLAGAGASSAFSFLPKEKPPNSGFTGVAGAAAAGSSLSLATGFILGMPEREGGFRGGRGTGSGAAGASSTSSSSSSSSSSGSFTAAPELAKGTCSPSEKRENLLRLLLSPTLLALLGGGRGGGPVFFFTGAGAASCTAGSSTSGAAFFGILALPRPEKSSLTLAAAAGPTLATAAAAVAPFSTGSAESSTTRKAQ
mmetsp:Transcript_8633/g.31846  ORF Transcript_8633/g.31846 Transcript_8633/m.31846 type:complete len:301 (+) Transcript_8633:723-1625(+)